MITSFIVEALDSESGYTTVGVIVAETIGEACQIAKTEFELNSIAEITSISELDLTEKGCS